MSLVQIVAICIRYTDCGCPSYNLWLSVVQMVTVSCTDDGRHFVQMVTSFVQMVTVICTLVSVVCCIAHDPGISCLSSRR